MSPTQTTVDAEHLETIIKDQLITPVFQPIVSLQDGSVFGFEALSRITQDGLFANVEDMFRYAEHTNNIWNLEQVCRRAILRAISQQKDSFDSYHAKLFINVNPKVLHDDKFQAGFTREYTSRYGINTDRITFEVTERERVQDEESFTNAINHYKLQDYQIAIDDVGVAYSGLNRICSLTPNYIKLDTALVRNVHNNPTKYALIKGLVEFSVNSGTRLIAEGIETQKELAVLIDLGVQYGQGFYLARPAAQLQACNSNIRQEIQERNQHKLSSHYQGISYFPVRNILRSALTVSSDTKVEQVLSYLKKNEDIIGICVIENQQVIGTLTREKFLKKLSGRYGFSLYSSKTIQHITCKNFLFVDANTPISNVTKLAMKREKDSLYDFIVVQNQNQYLGIVTVEDLLEKAMEINITIAKSSNPLTGLPGNLLIEQEMKQSVESGKPYTIYYFDLDNFKAFNDIYGFEKGDEVIRILADILKNFATDNDFVGHIGGDDFVMICNGYPTPESIDALRQEFENRSHQLYNDTDRKNGYITAPNRHGEIEHFPLVSVTIVSLSNETLPFYNYDKVVATLSHYKKQTKAAKH
ncbi:MAG: GGDEF domain-containing protein [Lachnospiraceae bacterium]|nr:GGDEF domain-containing protein [Lachnospiraceae bacterium]